MTKRSLVLFLFIAVPALAQLDPLRNVSGTTPNVGASPWVTSGDGAWTIFHGFSAHLTYVSETGPEVQRNETFSTNWITIGAQRMIGERGFVLVRGRASLEPFTIPDDDGYPQMLQYVSAESGGVLVDRMRPQNFIGEAAVHAGFKTTESTTFSIYAAYAGDPALGAAPFPMRASASDFAEAPFAYDIQESLHEASRVITASFSSRMFTIEGSVFHDSVSEPDYTKIDDGPIDSRSYRLTFTPSQNLAIQISRGERTKDGPKREVSTASLTYGTGNIAASALWTRKQEFEDAPELTAYGFELAMRGARNTFMARAEWVDRPDGFPDSVTALPTEQTTHFAVGYIFDFIARDRFRAGAGVNIDYHTQSHELPDRYGHKPQGIFAFIRVKSGRL